MKTRTLKPTGQVEIKHEAGEPRDIISATLPGDRYTVPQQVSLHRSHNGREWVTHRVNANDGSRFWGHYFTADEKTGGEVGAFRRAFRDYVKRCAELGVDAFPSAVLQGQHELCRAYDAHLCREIAASRHS